MRYSVETKTTEYYVRDNIYLHVTETDFFPLQSSYGYDSDWDMYPESEVEYTFILDEFADFEDSADRDAQRRETQELNTSDQSELIEFVLEDGGVEICNERSVLKQL